MTQPDESLIHGYTGHILFIVSTGTMLTYLSRLVLAPLLPTITGEIDISPAAAGFALSVMWLLVAIGQYPGGRYSDKLSRTSVLITALGILAVGLSLLLNVQNFSIFLLAVALVGLGGGLYLPPAFAFLSDLFRTRRGQAFGVNAAGIDVGGTIAGVLSIGVLALATWRAAFFPILVATLLTLSILHLWSRESYVFYRVDLEVLSTIRRLMRTPQMLRILIVFSLFTFVWQSVTSFLPTFLLEQGYSATIATNAFMALFVLGIFLRPVVGGIGDRIGHLLMATIASVFAATGLLVAIGAPGLSLLLPGILLMAVGLSGFWPVMNAHIMALFPTANMGGDFGATRTVFMSIGSIGPLYVGLVASVGTYQTAFIGLVACLLGSTVILMILFFLETYSE